MPTRSTDTTDGTDGTESAEISRYVDLNRAEWARLRASTPLPLSDAQLRPLGGVTERVSLDEVVDVYLPLSRLLNLYVGATQRLHEATSTFLGRRRASPHSLHHRDRRQRRRRQEHLVAHPAGAALALAEPSAGRLVTTDGFLMPQRDLEARGLAQRKGFPESYDVRRLLRFLADVKSGLPEVAAPVYSHLAYDIVPGEYQTVRQPDIVIVEGLNVLQTTRTRRGQGAGDVRLGLLRLHDLR